MIDRARLVALLLSLAVASCGEDGAQEGEDYGNLLESPGGLIVLQEEHPHGWGRSDCFLCHQIRNSHTVNRTGLPDDVVDLEGVRAIIQNQGEQSCPLCHGDNGVTE
jgi:hypothetical protein